MARRSSILLAALACGALAPATAHAQGSLLSGYGGPGSGEQVVLGAELLGGGGSGSGGAGGGGVGGSGGGGGGGGQVAPPGLRAATPTDASVAPATRSAPRRGTTGSGTPRSAGDAGGGRAPRASAPTVAANATVPAAAPGAPQRIAYPAADAAGTLPFSRDDILLLVGAMLAAALVAVAARRLTRWQPDGTPSA